MDRCKLTRTEKFQIGEVCDRVALSLRTVRHYDEVGLVVPCRTPGGFRLDMEDDADRLLLIKRMKPLGFTLEEMADLLSVGDRLNTDDLAPAERDKLLEQLAVYASDAKERCAKLRKQLEYAEDFAHTLQQRVDQYHGIAAVGAEAVSTTQDHR